MKKCLNCNTLNEPDTHICKACRMPDRFTPLAPAQPSPSETPPTVQVCRNCGQDAQGMAQCPHCRFPQRPALKASSVALHIPAYALAHAKKAV